MSDLKNMGFPSLSGVSVDVATACNLNCPHCFIPEESRHSKQQFIDVKRFEKLIPVLTKLSCRNINLTGGESFLHNEIRHIIQLCKESGLKITLFTNGTFLDEDTARFLRTYPIFLLVISFYAASDEEYERLSIKGEKGLFSRICSGVKAVKAMNIPYRLQTFHFKDNINAYERLKRVFPEEKTIARGWAAMPRSSCDYSNQQCMVSVEEVSDHLIPRSKKLGDPISHLREYLYNKKAIYNCGAGISGFHITTDFKVKPCIFIQDSDMAFSLDSYTLEDIFFEKMPSACIREMPAESPCCACSIRRSCSRCAAFGYGADWAGSGNRVLCRIADIRHKSPKLN